ncbi:MAG TPA: glutathionylspermidine synthase family protein [Candidatus Eremiobacteraeota bacterium]|nr:glutathionylspermidine synthase family protein [Candidatus Eremiobacteraeota bacterium]
MNNLIKSVNADYDTIIKELDRNELKANVEDFNIKLKQNRVHAWGKVLPTFIKPYFLSAEQVEEFKKSVNIILTCQEKIINLYFQDEKYRDLYELKDTEIPLVEIPKKVKRNIYFSRMDAIMCGDTFKFLEFNCDSPGGAYFADLQVSFLKEIKVMKLLEEKYDFIFESSRDRVFETLMEAWEEFGLKKRPNFAVVGDPNVANVEEFKLFAEDFEKKGYSSFFTDPWGLHYTGEKLTKDGKDIDLIYRRGVLKDYSGEPAKVKPVVDACRDGRVCIVNPFCAKLGDNKNLLSVLTDEKMSFLFTEEEREMIKKHIPWTRIVRNCETDYKNEKINLLPFIRENRKNLVLKPNSEYGGKGVFVGPDCTDEDWEKAMETAKTSPYVAQEYVTIPVMEFPVFEPDLAYRPKKFNINFFTFGGKYGGGFCRTSDSSVINISAGGALVTFVVVKGKK